MAAYTKLVPTPESKIAPSVAATSLDAFDPRTAGAHDPGQLIILFDNRHILPKAEDNKMSTFSIYYLSGLSRMGWANYWYRWDDLVEPGRVGLVWYTVCIYSPYGLFLG